MAIEPVYKIGEIVTCFNNSTKNQTGKLPELEMYKEYEVLDTANCPVCGVQCLDVGLRLRWTTHRTRCTCGGLVGGNNNKVHWASARRFERR